MNTRGITEKMQDWQQRATQGARDLGNTADRYVRENTWLTLGIAAALGCVVGYLLVGNREDSED